MRTKYLLGVLLLSGDLHAFAEEAGDTNIRWGSIIQQSSMFLGIQHGFRLATEPGTREGMKGPFLRGWAESVTSLHGWADGDPFLVNYIGHPMQGSVTSYIWIQNDPRFQSARFGRNAHYWKSRLRAAAFAWAYSTQFELGPVSEASLGKVQNSHPQQGVVDHVITPSVGMLWTVGEDFIDEKIILPLESRIESRYLRFLLRGGLNPSRSMANLLRFERPWRRDTRPSSQPLIAEVQELPPALSRPELQFSASPQFTSFQSQGGPRTNCIGAAGQAEFSISEPVSLVLEAGGCKVFDGPAATSADVISFLGGVKLYPTRAARWNPYVQVLTGLQRVTVDRYETQESVKSGLPSITNQADGFTLSAGSGVELVVWRPLTIRVAEVRVAHVWSSADPWPNRTAVGISSGLTLRFGTW